MNIVCVIQARMASTRLPGKVLMPFKGVPTLRWIIAAAQRAKGISNVVVATSTNTENDEIETACSDWNVDCFRGDEDDVLARYIGLIDKYQAHAVVRITGDCPLIDSNVISDLVSLYKSGEYDYVSNTEPPTWPDGLDCEIISTEALRAANREATRKSDRECVTRWMVRNRCRVPTANLTCPIPLHKERWVLDSPEDALFIKTIFDYFDISWNPNWHDIYNLLQDQPKLRLLNGGYNRNERFYESLVTDIAEPKKFTISNLLFNDAEKLIPFAAQTFSKSHLQFPKGDSPLFVSHGDGGYCYDVDGNDYVDMVGALLPNVLGYRDPDVDYAVRRQLDSGTSLSLATELEYKLASLLKKHIPCAEMVKFGKNGSDVTTAAVRLARAITGRDQVMVCGYHGWHDWSMAVSERQLGIPLPVQHLSLKQPAVGQPQWGDPANPPAAIIIEPDSNPTILPWLREVCTQHGVILIFDEIITGFRWSLGGYQKHIGVTPDLACFGKAMANGMPLSAVVGKAEYMKRFAPPDNIFYSGTFFGEALSLAAGIATIEKMEREGVINHNLGAGVLLQIGIKTSITDHNIEKKVSVSNDPHLLRLKFDTEPDRSLFMAEMIQAGVLIIGSCNVCYAHNKPEIDITLNAFDRAFGTIGRGQIGKSKIYSLPVRA